MDCCTIYNEARKKVDDNTNNIGLSLGSPKKRLTNGAIRIPVTVVMTPTRRVNQNMLDIAF
jgi:hypothetical protein